MKQTPNYNLNKLEGPDTADLTQFNPNWDTLDTNLKQQSDDYVAHKAETATETQKGHVEFATTAETTTGTNATKAVHPAGLRTELDKKSDTRHSHTVGDVGAAPSSHVGAGGAEHPAVTTAVAGFMSASDKSKLNGIETGATADQTAAEIIAALKTVDGSGSGLNADLLDGFHASYANITDTVVRRNSNGDINARLFRSEYDSTNSNIGFIMTQVDTANNNYIRPSTPAQVRTGLGVVQTRVHNGQLQYYDGGWKDVSVSPIKSIQRGIYSGGISSNDYVDINITAVNLDKAFINLPLAIASTGAIQIYAYLYNNTRLRVVNKGSAIYSGGISWEVIEFI